MWQWLSTKGGSGRGPATAAGKGSGAVGEESPTVLALATRLGRAVPAAGARSFGGENAGSGAFAVVTLIESDAVTGRSGHCDDSVG